MAYVRMCCELPSICSVVCALVLRACHALTFSHAIAIVLGYSGGNELLLQPDVCVSIHGAVETSPRHVLEHTKLKLSDCAVCWVECSYEKGMSILPFCSAFQWLARSCLIKISSILKCVWLALQQDRPCTPRYYMDAHSHTHPKPKP